MKFVTHNQTEIAIGGTSFKGYITADYTKLVAVFGTPTTGDEYKVDAEWKITFADGTVATIYNWKNGKNYLGDDGVDAVDITNWHVGGKSQTAYDYVVEALSAFKELPLSTTHKEDFVDDVTQLQSEDIQGYILLVVTKEGMCRRVNIQGSDVIHFAGPLKELSDEFANDVNKITLSLLKKLMRVADDSNDTKPTTH